MQDNRRKLIFLLPALLLLVVPNVYAGGPRLDWPEDSSDEGKDCWVEGYDAGFAGKYDKARADQCVQENDEYNRSWEYACIDSGLTKIDCDHSSSTSAVSPVHLQHCYSDAVHFQPQPI